MTKTTQEIEALLHDRAMTVSSTFLRLLSTVPQGVRLPALAVVVDEHGEGGLLVINDIEHRVELLAEHTKDHGIVGFAIVYDGYVSQQCKRCDGSGCEFCAGRDKRKCDAILTLIRTKWGFSDSKSVGYGWDDMGNFIMRAEFNFELGGVQGDRVLDRYDAVFAPATVN